MPLGRLSSFTFFCELSVFTACSPPPDLPRGRPERFGVSGQRLIVTGLVLRCFRGLNLLVVHRVGLVEQFVRCRPSEVNQKVKARQARRRRLQYALLRDEVTDNEKALSSFKNARSQFKDDPDVELYIDQTIPILKAHLEMAKNLESQVGTSGTENPANNKRQ